MKEYLVTWSIEVSAEHPQEAAEIAQCVQRDLDSLATFFNVTDLESGQLTSVDLSEEEED